MLFLKGNSLLTKCHLTKTLNIQILYSLSALTHLVYGLLQAQGISEEKKNTVYNPTVQQWHCHLPRKSEMALLLK